MAKIGQHLMPQVSSSQKVSSEVSVAPHAEPAELQQVQKPTVPPRQSHELAIVCADLTLVKRTIINILYVNPIFLCFNFHYLI